jgi:hypothetical protein
MNYNRAAAMSERECNSTNSIDLIVYSLCMNVPKSGGAEVVCREEEVDQREEGGVKIFSLLKEDESRELSLGI